MTARTAQNGWLRLLRKFVFAVHTSTYVSSASSSKAELRAPTAPGVSPKLYSRTCARVQSGTEQCKREHLLYFKLESCVTL